MNGVVEMRHDVPASCRGERCGPCQREYGIREPATHKVEEVILDTRIVRPPFVQYVCCEHFSDLMGPAAAGVCEQR